MRRAGKQFPSSGFGAEFIPIYQRHPDARMAAICQRTESKLNAIGNAYDIETRYTDFKAMLEDPDIDLVHINSPIPDHGQGAGHGGSHPHLAHEIIDALVKNRDPYPNARQSANWTCVGLCAHESALKGGRLVYLPKFTL